MERSGVVHGDIFTYPRRALRSVAGATSYAQASEATPRCRPAKPGLAASPATAHGGVVAWWAAAPYARGAVVMAFARRRWRCIRWPSPGQSAVIGCVVTSRRGRTEHKAIGEFRAWPLHVRLVGGAGPRAIRPSFGWPEPVLLMCIIESTLPGAELIRSGHVSMLPRPVVLR